MSEDDKKKSDKTCEVVDQFRNFGSALYTYQDYADDFDLSESEVLNVLNRYNRGLSKEEVIEKLTAIKPS